MQQIYKCGNTKPLSTALHPQLLPAPLLDGSRLCGSFTEVHKQ